MELNHRRECGPFIAIETINELAPDILAALAERPLYRKLFDAAHQLLLGHTGIQCEQIPNGAVERQRRADVFAIQRHTKFSSKNSEMRSGFRTVDNKSHNSLIQAGCRPLHQPGLEFIRQAQLFPNAWSMRVYRPY
jgi:hypothetical protein